MVGGFPVGLLSYDDVWIVRSHDGVHWTRPAFAFQLAGGPLEMRLAWREGRLIISRRATRPPPESGGSGGSGKPFRTVISPRDLVRDRDRDGLPDRLERRLGTDPARWDTNGNGIADGSDKNPLYRPHPLTDEEGIYQAVLEALCQLGRSTGPRYNGLPDQVWGLGSRRGPLLLQLPQGSSGIELLGYRGMVLCDPSPGDGSYAGVGVLHMWNTWNVWTGHFSAPLIGLDGIAREQENGSVFYTGDPFTAEPGPQEPTPFRFHDYLPYERSGARARVGWRQGDLMDGGPSRFGHRGAEDRRALAARGVSPGRPRGPSLVRFRGRSSGAALAAAVSALSLDASQPDGHPPEAEHGQDSGGRQQHQPLGKRCLRRRLPDAELQRLPGGADVPQRVIAARGRERWGRESRPVQSARRPIGEAAGDDTLLAASGEPDSEPGHGVRHHQQNQE